jgi:hypothetical protein
MLIVNGIPERANNMYSNILIICQQNFDPEQKLS